MIIVTNYPATSDGSQLFATVNGRLLQKKPEAVQQTAWLLK